MVSSPCPFLKAADLILRFLPFVVLASFVSVSLPTSAAEPTLLSCKTLTAIDGDSIRCNGENMRMMVSNTPQTAGYDTPEIGNGRSGSKCKAERMLGKVATRRLAELLAIPGINVWDSGERDQTQSQRPLVWIELPDGTSVGDILLDEGLALPWTPGAPINWCDGL